MAIDIEQNEENGNAVIKPTGEIDLYSSSDLRKVLLAAIPKGTGAVGIDLSAVPYMDSSGVATLVEGLKACGKAKRRFTLLRPSEAVMKVLQLSRLDSVFEITQGF